MRATHRYIKTKISQISQITHIPHIPHIPNIPWLSKISLIPLLSKISNRVNLVGLSKRKLMLFTALIVSSISFLTLSILLHSIVSSIIPPTEEEEVLQLFNDDETREKYRLSFNDSALDLSIFEAEHNGKARIPHHVVLLDTRYETFFDIPSPLQENMQNTIETYLDSWADENDEIKALTSSPHYKSHYDKVKAMVESPYVWYLNNEECINSITQVAPDLISYFLNETKGQNKANLCRIAALYIRGGYYFDTDMQIVKAVHIDPHVTFMSPWEKRFKNYKGLFNSFIAIAPNHPMIAVNIELMRDFYIRKKTNFHLLGTGSLYKAFLLFYDLSVSEATNMRDGKVIFSEDESLITDNSTKLIKPTGIRKKWPVEMFLGEIHLSEENYKEHYRKFPRHDNTRKDRCDYVVHDFRAKEIFFYSRISGCSSCRILNKIPRRAVFIDTTVESLKDSKKDSMDNIMYIAKVYGKSWNETYNNNYKEEKDKKKDYEKRLKDKLALLGDKDCRGAVRKVEPRLYSKYMGEENHAVKRKLCRLVYLYDKGGYYFDVNLKVNNPVFPPNEEISFIQPLTTATTSSNDTLGFTDSFMAVAPKHPLIRLQLEKLVNFYDSDGERTVIVHNEQKYEGEKSSMHAMQDFYARNGTGINLAYWNPDFSLIEVDLGGKKTIANVLFSTSNKI